MSNKLIPIEQFKKRKPKQPVQAELHDSIIDKVKHLFEGQSQPASFSLRSKVPQVYDQGDIGSCTANAFCAAYNLLNASADAAAAFWPSRLWVYYFERLLEDPSHNPNDITDSGADVIDGEYYVRKKGVCSETSWPYDVSQVNVEPPESCDADAAQHKISSYRAIKAEAIKQYLLAGTPCLIAIQVYQSFENSQGGIIPMPSPPSDQLLGGHELCVVGYDDASSTFEVQNSWGASWGDAGFCHVPYSYIDDKSLCSEVTFIGL